MNLEARLVQDGFGYLEGARWNEGALWFSDIKQRRTYRFHAQEGLSTVLEMDERPSGLGWDPEGNLLVVAMEDDTLRRVDHVGNTAITHELSKYLYGANDMAVDREGRAYITQFGYDLFAGGEPQGSHITVAYPDGSVKTFGRDLIFPNGIGFSADARTLFVAESFAARITIFDIAHDGSLSNQRIFASFGDVAADVLDGICVDSESAVWVAAPFRREFWRVVAGGKITDRIAPAPGSGSYCVDCVLGGDDMRTMYLLVADTDVERLGNDWDASATIQTVRVPIPGIEAASSKL